MLLSREPSGEMRSAAASGMGKRQSFCPLHLSSQKLWAHTHAWYHCLSHVPSLADSPCGPLGSFDQGHESFARCREDVFLYIRDEFVDG